MNSWPSAARCPATIAHLRLFDRKRRGLADLPSHELIEILRARRDLLELDERHLRHDVRHDEADAPRPAESLQHAIERGGDGRPVERVRRGQRGHERALGQAARRRAPRPPAARRASRASRPTPGWRRSPTAARRRRRLAERSEQTHSTNVTLLISRNVVVPLMTRSTADSRRNRIPSSRAAFLISDVGRFSRIISRM